MSWYRHTNNDALSAVQTQAVFCILGWILVTGCSGKQAGIAFLSGSMICLATNIIMYRCVFAKTGARHAKKIVKSFYFGEAAKLLLTAFGFAVALWLGVKAPWLFCGYIFAQAVFWVFPLLWAVSQKITTSRMLNE